MTEKLSKEQLDAIRERADAATPGPWVWHGGYLLTLDDAASRHSAMGRCVLALDCDSASVIELVRGEYIREVEDAELIAAAREDIPALLAHIDAQDAEIESLRNSMHDAARSVSDIYSLARRGVLADPTREGGIIDLARSAGKSLLARFAEDTN